MKFDVIDKFMDEMRVVPKEEIQQCEKTRQIKHNDTVSLTSHEDFVEHIGRIEEPEVCKSFRRSLFNKIGLRVARG
jgi:hypothetical protein